MITVNKIRKEFRISNEECCNNTICNVIKKHGLLWKSRRKKATYGQQSRAARVRFCKSMLKWTDKKLKRLVFIDGCTVHWPRSVKAMRDATSSPRMGEGRNTDHFGNPTIIVVCVVWSWLRNRSCIVCCAANRK